MGQPQPDMGGMKLKVARTLKWNVIDKVASQLLYALTGLILANMLSPAEFGVVGAILVFQAFASLFVDSGFSYALIQRKSPTDLDYSTVLWFNMGMAGVVYVGLWFAAPWIMTLFKDAPEELVPLSRVMFLTFILNGSAIVQTNRLMKRMDVKMVAVSNSLGLFVGAIVGIGLALLGYGAWALVWQAVAVAAVKSGVLWLTGKWVPMLRFSWRALKSFLGVGMGMAMTSFLNTLFQNIYSYFIGNKVGVTSLGYYTQADKWSKMGISSLSAVITSSFLPVLAEYQDDAKKFASATAKMNRFTSYLLFPAMGMLILMAEPIFHTLFGTKWDASVALFQLLLVRGIFTVLTQLYANYVLALGRAKLNVHIELLRDGIALLAIFITLPYIALAPAMDITLGVRIFIMGQVVASAVAWIVTLFIAARLSRRSWSEYLTDSLPYMMLTVLILVPMWYESRLISAAWVLCLVQGVTGIVLYMLANKMLGSKIQSDAIAYFMHRGKKKSELR